MPSHRSASVSNVAAISSLKKLRSHTFRLRLQYEGQSAGAPDSIILKGNILDAAVLWLLKRGAA